MGDLQEMMRQNLRELLSDVVDQAFATGFREDELDRLIEQELHIRENLEAVSSYQMLTGAPVSLPVGKAARLVQKLGEVQGQGTSASGAGQAELSATGLFQIDDNYLLGGKEGWTLRAKLHAGLPGQSPKQIQVEFLVDTGCTTFDAIIPCKKAEQLGLERCGQDHAIAFGGNRISVHRFTPAVQILVPLWEGGVEVNKAPKDTRSAWIELWGVDEEPQHSQASKVAMLTYAHDTEEDSSTVSSELGEPSTPTRVYEGTFFKQFSPLTHSKSTAILGLPALTRLRLKLDVQHRRVHAITGPRKVVSMVGP